MPWAINIKTTGTSAAPLFDLWDKAAYFEHAPSMPAIGYPPHITFGIYDHIDVAALCDAFRMVFAEQACFRLRFNRIRWFKAQPLVLWAEPNETQILHAIHAKLNRLADPDLCREHYRSGQWQPHVTLATDVREDTVEAALSWAKETSLDIRADFQSADCVEAYPVRIIEEIDLPV